MRSAGLPVQRERVGKEERCAGKAVISRLDGEGAARFLRTGVEDFLQTGAAVESVIADVRQRCGQFDVFQTAAVQKSTVGNAGRVANLF